MAKRYLATVSFHFINLCTFVQSCQNKQVLRENSHTHKQKIYSLTFLQTCAFITHKQDFLNPTSLDMQCQLETTKTFLTELFH